MDEEDSRTKLVVVYDYCVPKRPFIEIVPPRADFAKHIFAVSDILSYVIRSSDERLFAYVAEELKQKYPDAVFVIITVDRGFDREVMQHEAYGKGVVEVKIIPPCNGKNLSRRRAYDVAQWLRIKYMSVQQDSLPS